jgi:hypothetical protein
LPIRDKQSDDTRIDSIWTAVRRAVHEAERERLGLERRVNQATTRLCLATDSDGSYEEREREREVEEDLRLFENQLTVAVERLRSLTSHIRVLLEAGATLNRLVPNHQFEQVELLRSVQDVAQANPAERGAGIMPPNSKGETEEI